MAQAASQTSTELGRAVAACRSAFALCALFSLVINLLMLASPLYMLQVYDRVLTTGRVEDAGDADADGDGCAGGDVRPRRLAQRHNGARRLLAERTAWARPISPAPCAVALRARRRAREPLRDIAQVQGFIATQGLNAFFDAPWVPIFVALIWILHPLLGMVAVGGAVRAVRAQHRQRARDAPRPRDRAPQPDRGQPRGRGNDPQCRDRAGHAHAAGHDRALGGRERRGPRRDAAGRRCRQRHSRDHQVRPLLRPDRHPGRRRLAGDQLAPHRGRR